MPQYRIPADSRLSRLDRRIRIVLAANFIAVAARMSLVTFLGIWFVREAQIPLATVGLAFLCENLLRGFLAPVFGALSDRIGRRSLLVASAALTAAILPAFLLVEGPASLFLWSAGMGLTGAVNMPVASALLLDLAPPERRQSVLALNYTSMSVAYTIAVSPAGYLAELGYGYLAASTALGYGLVALLYFVFLRNLRAEKAPGGRQESFSALKDRSFLAFAAVAFIFPFSMGLVVSASPLFAADYGIGEGYIGLVLGGNSILVALLALPVAWRIEAAGPARFLGWAAFIVAAALACYGAIPHAAAALLVGTIVFSFAEAVFSSAVPATVARLAPAGRRGAYQGAWALVQSLSMGSALFVSGLLRDAIGWRAAWIAFAVLALAAGAGLFRQRLQERDQVRAL
jgi:MFS transporter, DHA1 family, tetracycline resistance protein